MRIPFVNRNEEIEYLLKLASQGVRIPLFIYGPEGCGKTRLLEELNSILRSKNFVSLYIDAKEYSIEQAIRGSSREFVDLLLDIASDITEPFGKVFIKLISKIINEYERRYRFKGKKLVLLVDEVVEGIGFENIERYTKILYDLANDILDKFNAESILVIATTREERSRDILSRHSYVHLSYLWNLSKDSFEELAKILNSPIDIIEDLYIYTSGNPRALIDIASMNWDVSKWIEMLFRERIASLLYEDIVIQHLDELEKVVTDPDNAMRISSNLRNFLIEKNMIMYLGNPLISKVKPSKCKDLGIGDFFAWQMNIYRILIEERILKTKRNI